MTRNGYLLLIGTIAISVSSAAAAVTWKGGSDIYDTLAECLKHHPKCTFEGTVVRVDSWAELMAARTRATSARQAGRGPQPQVLRYLVDTGRAPRRPPPVEGSGGGIQAIYTTACMNAGGEFHKLPCGGGEVRVIIDE